METVEDVTMGSNRSEGEIMADYNDAINILNNATSKYLNTTYANSVRCVGSVPDNPSYENSDRCGWTAVRLYERGEDNHETDFNQMETLGLNNIGKEYWLASRKVAKISNYYNIVVRSVGSNGILRRRSR